MGIRDFCDIVLVVTQSGALEFLQAEVHKRVQAEGLRPLAARTGIPLARLRSLLVQRDMRSSNAAQAAAAFDLEFYIGPPRPAVPPEILEALGLDADAAVADAVAEIAARRDPRVEALLAAVAALQKVQDLIHAVAGCTHTDPTEAAARANGNPDLMEQHWHDKPTPHRGGQPQR